MKKQFLLSLMAMLLPLTSWAEGLTIEFTKNVGTDGKVTFEYAGTDTEKHVKEAVKVFADGKELTEGQFILYVTYAENSKTAKIGEATVEAWGQDEYTRLTGSKTCDITPLVVKTKFNFDRLGEAGVSKMYGQSDQVVLEQLITLDDVRTSLAAGEPEAEFADFLNCLEVARQEGTSNSDYVNEKGYTVFVQGKNSGFTSNYKYEKPETASYTTLHITKRPLTVILLDEERNDYIGRAYTGVKFDFDAIINSGRYKFGESEGEGIVSTDKNKEIAIESLAIATPTGATEIKNVDKYTLTATLTAGEDYADVVNNYEVQSVEFEITPAAVTIKAAEDAKDLSSEYTGIVEEKEVANTNFNFDGIVSGETAEGLKLIVKAEIDGEASVTKKGEGYGFKLYQGEEKTATEVTKNEAGVYASGNYTYTFDEGLEYLITPKSLGSLSDSYKGEGITGAVKANTVFTYTGKDYADAENVGDVKDNIEVKYANGSTDGLPLAYETDYTIVVVGYDQPTNAKKGVAINANEKFTIAVIGTGNYEGQYNIAENTIAKAELQITLKEDVDAAMTFKKIANGKGSGNLAQYFDFDGLVENDAVIEDGNVIKPLETVLTMQAKNTTARKNPYMIRVYNGDGKKFTEGGVTEDDPNDEVLDNYIITKYDLERYLILPEIEFVLDRDAEDSEDGATQSVATLLETYNGTSPEKVIIRQDQTIKANTWTALVLPFATTAREISKAFDYAVVDVPNTSNTNKDQGAFSLKVMGEIEANTLILIKTDVERYLGKESKDGKKSMPLEFDLIDLEGNKRTIDYDPTYFVKDGAENIYQGVYKTTEDIKGWKGYYYMSDGDFYPAEKRTRDTFIKALGGYIILPNANPATARIIVEEPDGSTTAINAASIDVINVAEGWYSVGGMKQNAQPTQKGVYINNGKKVVIK